MRVTSILREALKVKDHRIVTVQSDTEGFQVRLDVKRRRHLPCSRCGRRAPVRDRLPERRWHHLPLWDRAVALVYRPARVACPTCGIKVEAIPWSRGKSRLSRGMLYQLAKWTRVLTWEEAARLFHVSWGTVQSAVREAVELGLKERGFGDVRNIGIDEISRRRGHTYVTCVYDLDRKILLWVGEGRTKATLRAFFSALGPEGAARITGVCCDMWEPYRSVVEEQCPNAVLVFDKFHIIKHLSEAIDKIRREEMHAMEKEHKKALKGVRFLLLKNRENVTGHRRFQLSDLVKMNLKTIKGYLLKEHFRRFWRYTRKAWARKFLNHWFWLATHSRIKPLRDFAWMLRRHEEGILAYFDTGLTNATVEGLNNKAKKVSHRAYGFSTPHTFILNLYHCLGGLPLPNLCTNS